MTKLICVHILSVTITNLPQQFKPGPLKETFCRRCREVILHRYVKIIVTATRLYGNFSTIRYNENAADDKRYSSLASSKACEWTLAKKRENEDDGKVTQAECLDYNATHIHTLCDKLSKFNSRFSHSCRIHFDRKKIHILPQNSTPSFSRGLNWSLISGIYNCLFGHSLSETLEITKFLPICFLLQN